MFYNAHSVFVKSKSHQILGDVMKEAYGVLKRKGFDDFLYKMSCIVVSAQFIEIFHYLHRNKGVLFI